MFHFWNTLTSALTAELHIFGTNLSQPQLEHSVASTSRTHHQHFTHSRTHAHASATTFTHTSINTMDSKSASTTAAPAKEPTMVQDAAASVGDTLQSGGREIKSAAGVEKTWSESASDAIQSGKDGAVELGQAVGEITGKAAQQTKDTTKDLATKAGDMLNSAGTSIKSATDSK